MLSSMYRSSTASAKAKARTSPTRPTPRPEFWGLRPRPRPSAIWIQALFPDSSTLSRPHAQRSGTKSIDRVEIGSAGQQFWTSRLRSGRVGSRFSVSETRGSVLEGKKVKVAHTRLPSVGFRSWSRFLTVRLQVTWVINPAVGWYWKERSAIRRDAVA